MFRSLKLGLVTLPALALGLAACGSASTPTSTATTAAGVTATTAGVVMVTTTTAPPPTTAAPPTTAPKPAVPIPVADRSPAGTFGKAPTVVVPPGAPPAQLESADLITGTGAVAKDGDSLTLQYVLATYSSRKVVQSSWTAQPFTFVLGKGQVIPGWDQGVVGMRVGGRRELIIPPSLGYGATSQGPGIAANDTLIFVVDLLKIG
jgi:peptidylprolyl isomerase